MNLETKITIYKFTPQVFTLTRIKRFNAQHDNEGIKEPVRRKWGFFRQRRSVRLKRKKNKTKEEMNTTKKPSRTCGNTGAGRLLIFYTILRYALTTASYSCLLRRFLIQIECYECIKQVRYPYRYDGRHITIHCKCRGNRLEQDIRET